ncbi:ParB/RepB/Spo0J family partition protein [Sphingopyxis panaciterrulae]|uniref:ParB family chromosome partitioning protein n=2 Tax=Sphingopyxis TaxID=165697 RepID=A0A7W9B8H5_9SPHN|nr:ParB N-terminal domain-containing protein [Sphingopyxis panaciterrulae]MBB5708197.1 ParB family chromosome partitioning protein [Sphingopyxis panaciterrulae]SBV32597.1 ParB-like protein [uncultured Sphingopyxis sp.]
MKLDFIPLDKLSVDPANMRAKGRDPDVSDILPSVRKRGVLVSLLVRPAAEDGHFRISAGRRRFTAANIVVREGGPARPLPCGILDEDDDADAIEASMLENLARVAPDEVSQWEAFVKLVKAGRKVEEIAADFAFEVPTVKRILALGNLLPRIRTLYRGGEIDQTTVKQLTLASKSQQTAWLALFDDKDAYCPTGFRLKDWLFGGNTIKADHALFDVEEAKLAVIADLFGDERLVTDTDAFWTRQMAEVEARRAGYIEDGWSDVVVLDCGQRFDRYDHRHTSKRQGGRVYVEVRKSGEVTFHEGFLTEKEAAKRARNEGLGSDGGAAPDKVQRPEVTSAMGTYIDLHRHAVVRAELAKHGGVALRAMAAHVIANADHYRVETQSYVCAKDEVQESVETCGAEVMFDERRRAVLGVLGFDGEDLTVTARRAGHRQFAPIFARLLELPDPVVLEILAIVMGETLAAGSEAVEMIGQYLDVDMAKVWTPDAAFWNQIRDKEVLGRIVAEVAGDDVAAANAGQQAKVLKTIVTDHLDGANGRPKVEGWVPRWMRFAPSAYTSRGGVGSVAAHDRLLHIIARAAEADAAREAEAAAVGEGETDADAGSRTATEDDTGKDSDADTGDAGDGAAADGDTALAA